MFYCNANYIHTGCAEKKMSLWEKMAPQTMPMSFVLLAPLCPTEQSGAYNPDACLRNNTSSWRIQRSV